MTDMESSLVSDMTEEDLIREIEAIKEEMKKESSKPAPVRHKKKKQKLSLSKKVKRHKAVEVPPPARKIPPPAKTLEKSIQKLEQSVVAAVPGSRKEEMELEREIKLVEKQLAAMEAPKSQSNSATVCICRKPYDRRIPNIKCEGCQGWYHLSCLGLSSVESDCIEKYFCDKCQRSRKKGRKKTTYKPIAVIESEVQGMTSASRIAQEIKNIENILQKANEEPEPNHGVITPANEVCCICNFPGTDLPCSRCSKVYHGRCLSKLPDLNLVRANTWVCDHCSNSRT